MKRHLDYEVKINERFIYRWTCPICGEENEVGVSVVKVFLPCPVCNVTFRRDEISSRTWRLLTDRQERENQVEPVPELDLGAAQAAVALPKTDRTPPVSPFISKSPQKPVSATMPRKSFSTR